MKLMMKLKMKLTFWPAVLGALLFETLILPNQAQAQTEQFRAGVVRALPRSSEGCWDFVINI